MKKILTTLLILQSFSLILFAQKTANSEAFDIFNKKNKEVINLFKQEKFKEAQELAFEVLALSKKRFGEDHIETATTYSNIAEIYRMRKKYDESVKHFDLALKIFETDSTNYITKIIPLLKSKGTVLALDGKEKAAEKIFEKYIAIAEKTYGADSKEMLPLLRDQWNFYLYIKDYDKVEKLFIRRNIVSIKADNTEELVKVTDETACYLHNRYRSKELLERSNYISKAVKEDTYTFFNKDEFAKRASRAGGGVVNGKAITLAKPDYPMVARAQQIRGSVLVKIVIGKDGNVISANAFCGPRPLLKAAEDAANRSKFLPTSLDGENVEVSGTIVYNFQ